MMRANLLPRPKETVTAFGLEIDLEYLRQALIGTAIVLAIVAIGIGIETMRAHRIESAADAQEAYLLSQLPKRDEAKALALDVARYQEIAREEDAVRRSGALAALDIARIGNAVPNRVWLDSLSHVSAGFELIGESRSVDAIGGTMLALGNVSRGRSATLVSIDNRDSTAAGVHFTARIADAPHGSGTP